MKKLFLAIRHGELETVRAVLTKKPALIDCTAKPPPKKDAGQSLLQVAIKTGHFEIADYLLDAGADVNFMEAADCGSAWRAPVLHDAITAAIMCSRWNVYSTALYGGVKVFHSKEECDAAYHVLARMISLGADVNAEDSYGNSCVDRACLQARQILPAYNHATNRPGNDRILTAELVDDLRRIFALLYKSGADFDHVQPNLKMSAREFFQSEPVSQFLPISRRKKDP